MSTSRRLAAFDLTKDTVVWEQTYGGKCCDRMAVSPDGRTLYVPAAGGCETGAVTVTDHPELVAALLAVSGVAAAAVEPDDDGPGTLRLQLEPGADEVGVAGEVNRLLRSRFGLAVDADRVRVVDEPTRPPDQHDRPGAGQEDPPRPVAEAVEEAEAERPEAPPLPDVTMSRPGRLVIERVALVSAGLGTTVSVSLGLDGQSYEGSAEGTSTAGSLHRSVAGATLRAVEAVVEGSVRFDVEHVEIATTGPDRTALVVLTMVTDRATQRLSGASVVREDVRQAVIRAVLAAVNRRVEPLLGEVVA